MPPTQKVESSSGFYFLDLAAELAETSPVPLMLTGGITCHYREWMEARA